SSTAAAVTFITFVQDLKKKTKTWGPMIELCGSGEKTLERFRYQFPDDWLYSDQLQGEWSAFNEILKRKNDSIQEQLAGLQLKIVAEDKIVENKITDLLAEWEQTRPVQGNMRADTAMNTINVFEGKLSRVQEEYDLPVIEELRDLKAVWTALSGIWNQVGDLRDSQWATIQPRKLRQSLDALLASTKDMPTRMRQYAAFEYVQDMLRGLLKANTVVSELKSDALKERHWKQLFKVLRLPSQLNLTHLTLGQVYDLDLKKNEALIKDVIIQAQGEANLDQLYARCTENLNSLTAMKLSPYYKVFEEEAGSWEEKLNRIHVLFDIWIDVQRQWVYKSPFVIDVMNIQGVQKSLERLKDMLQKIQKALGEYLERERSSFPRFY
ncbi:hypothetical protein EXIGLDRAFT_592494, partial [Exidia glandulosa HHB12029]